MSYEGAGWAGIKTAVDLAWANISQPLIFSILIGLLAALIFVTIVAAIVGVQGERGMRR
jgi:thioredoxin reductase